MNDVPDFFFDQPEITGTQGLLVISAIILVVAIGWIFKKGSYRNE